MFLVIIWYVCCYSIVGGRRDHAGLGNTRQGFYRLLCLGSRLFHPGKLIQSLKLFYMGYYTNQHGLEAYQERKRSFNTFICFYILFTLLSLIKELSTNFDVKNMMFKDTWTEWKVQTRYLIRSESVALVSVTVKQNTTTSNWCLINQGFKTLNRNGNLFVFEHNRKLSVVSAWNSLGF